MGIFDVADVTKKGLRLKVGILDQKCPKCNFERKNDDIECPKCGIIYEKYFAYIEKKKKMAAEKSAPQKEHHPTDGKLISELFDFVLDFADIPDITD